jgi:hypothetical protein
LLFFVATTQQNDDRVAFFLEVDAVSGAIVNAQLANPLAYWLHITHQSKSQTVEA